ncbi:DUF3667 domain-containing protein [soil metagenome]
MSHYRRKKSYCQNCQYPLSTNYNFCPHCGQENNDKTVSFGTLISDFFSNYFAYDSKLVKTIKPFLFKPGFLTKEFISGRRTTYMHPLRFYLIISFIYFLIFSFTVIHDTQNKNSKFINFSPPDTQVSIPEVPYQGQQEKSPPATDILIESDTIQIDEEFIDPNEQPKVFGFEMDRLKVIQMPEATRDQVLDSLGARKSAFNLYLARQGIKIANERDENIYSYLVKNASLMMFFLLPFFALILKLFYLRRKRLYIEHITFTLHIHTFLFFILILALIIDYFWPNYWVFSIATYIILIYFLFSFKHFYQQKWVKTIFKIALLAVSYFFTFLIFFIGTVLISFLLL